MHVDKQCSIDVYLWCDKERVYNIIIIFIIIIIYYNLYSVRLCSCDISFKREIVRDRDREIDIETKTDRETESQRDRDKDR